MKSQNEAEERTAEEPFVEVLGGRARMKIIAAFLDTHDQDINISELAERSGVARSTIYEHIDALVDAEVVNETRTMGDMQMYQINAESDVVEGVKLLNVRCARSDESR